MVGLLPARRFTQEELQRAVPEPPSLALKVSAVLNVGLPILSLAVTLAGGNPPALPWLVLAMGGALLLALAVIWRDPSRSAVRWSYYALPVVSVPFALLIKRWLPEIDQEAKVALVVLMVAMALCLWFGMIHRYQYIVIRLRELDERDRAIDMARQLASAQIQPHFLFNSLASLQHWVHTHDDRAGPLLDSLTGYLRATLPLFEREHLTLAEELEAVRRYLEVMQARLGERLRFEVTLQPAAGSALLPPGVLLTLVENAVEHGVQPMLSGGVVRVAVRLGEGGETVIEVSDNGPGLPAAASPAVPAPSPTPTPAPTSTSTPASPCRGVGLANTRQRLAQAFGERASLHLCNLPEGGCQARLTLPPAPP